MNSDQKISRAFEFTELSKVILRLRAMESVMGSFLMPLEVTHTSDGFFWIMYESTPEQECAFDDALCDCKVQNRTPSQTFLDLVASRAILTTFEAAAFRKNAERWVLSDQSTGARIVCYLRADGRILIDQIAVQPEPRISK